MADFGDEASERTEKRIADALKAHAASAKPYEPGRPGECDYCGLQKNRLVLREGWGHVCAGCRARYRLG